MESIKRINPVKYQNSSISKTLSDLAAIEKSRAGSEEQPLHGEMSYLDAYDTTNKIINSSAKDASKDDDSVAVQRSKKRLPGGKVPQHILEHVQQANTEYIQGDFEKTRDILLQVIRKRPNYAYPYSVLANIAENDGDLELSLQCRTIFALIDNKYESWEAVLQIAQLLKKTNVQIYSLKRMSRMKHYEEFVLAELARIYLVQKLNRKAFKVLEKLISINSSDSSAVENYVKLAFEFGLNEKADNALVKYMESMDIINWSPDIFNLKCDLQMIYAQYNQTKALIEEYAAAHQKEIRELPPELIFHYGKALLFSHWIKEAEVVFKYLLDMPITLVGDIVMEVGIAYQTQERFLEAIDIFEYVKSDSKYEKLALYHIAVCYQKLKKIDKAISNMEAYMKLQTDKLEAHVRAILIELYTEKGEISKAIDIIQLGELQSEERELVAPQRPARFFRAKHKIPQEKFHDILLAVQQAEFFEEQANTKEFINQLLPFYYACVHIPPRVKRGSAEYFTNAQKEHLLALKQVDPSKIVDRVWMWEDIVVALGEEYALRIVLRLARAYVEIHEEARGFFLLETMLKGTISKEFLGNFKTVLIKLYINVGKYKQAYRHLRYAISRDIYNEDYWGLVYVFLQKGMNHASTFMMALLNKYPDCVPALIVLGHGSMHSGIDILALGYYLSALKQNPNNALLNLCIGSVFLNSMSRKYVTERHHIVINAFSYLYQYADVSKEYPMEVNYNLGRAYHQINLLTQAVHYYNKVLSYADHCTIAEENLIQEAAVNLSRLYADTGNTMLAITILNQYVEI